MAIVDISDFTRKLDALSKAYAILPNEIAATAVNFSKERFRDQAWIDRKTEPWKPRAKRRKGSPNKSQTLLVNTGRGKRGIRKILANQDKVIIGNDVPYMQIHNDGGIIEGTFNVRPYTKKEHTRNRKGRKEVVKSHKVGGHQRHVKTRIPSRRFIGSSYILERRLYSLIADRFTNALK